MCCILFLQMLLYTVIILSYFIKIPNGKKRKKFNCEKQKNCIHMPNFINMNFGLLINLKTNIFFFFYPIYFTRVLIILQLLSHITINATWCLKQANWMNAEITLNRLPFDLFMACLSVSCLSLFCVISDTILFCFNVTLNVINLFTFCPATIHFGRNAYAGRRIIKLMKQEITLYLYRAQMLSEKWCHMLRFLSHSIIITFPFAFFYASRNK